MIRGDGDRKPQIAFIAMSYPEGGCVSESQGESSVDLTKAIPFIVCFRDIEPTVSFEVFEAELLSLAQKVPGMCSIDSVKSAIRNAWENMREANGFHS